VGAFGAKERGSAMQIGVCFGSALITLK